MTGWPDCDCGHAGEINPAVFHLEDCAYRRSFKRWQIDDLTPIEPVSLEWVGGWRPFRASFFSRGRALKFSVRRWTPWAARESAERLQDAYEERRARENWSHFGMGTDID